MNSADAAEDVCQSQSVMLDESIANWQRRFWEHLIRDEADYARHVAYCYINPVKHALVTRVCDWPYSSFHRDVRRGLFQNDWAADVLTDSESGEAM